MNARCHISRTKRSHSASPPLANEWIGFISGDLWRPAKLGKEKREECEQRLVGRLSDCNNLAVANSASVMQETSSPLACSNVSPAVPQKKTQLFIFLFARLWILNLIVWSTNNDMYKLSNVMQETSSPNTQMSAQLCHKKRQGDQATVFTSFIMVSTLFNPIFNDICKHVTVINKEGEWVLGINT